MSVPAAGSSLKQSAQSARRSRRSWAIDFLLLFAVVAILIGPLFRVKYLDLWHSIESTFIADARFLADHWPHPNWQPNWYAGTRTDYIYPPALRYGTAALVKAVPNMLPVRAYHIYTAFFYCFGIAGTGLLARYGSRSRRTGLFAALAVAVISPSFLFVESIRGDSPLLMPYRLNVLIRYGEGPHMTALAWIPFALLFSWRALEKWRPASLAAAAACCAMVVSNNFYGATSLAMLFPVMAWSLYVTHRSFALWLRAALIAALAYGLTAFWLVPSYLEITVRNMQFVSSQGNMWSRWVALGIAVGFVLLTDQYVRGRRNAAWLTFLAGSTVLFFASAVGNHYLDFRIIGEPSRQFPELDMLIILLALEMLRRLWNVQRARPLARAAVVVAGVAAFVPSWQYLAAPHSVFVRDWEPQKRIEYQMQDWVAKNMPDARMLTSGSVRFWYNAWHDLPQLGGGSEQGLLNTEVVQPQWHVFLDPDADVSIRWLQLMGVDGIIVHTPESRELYHDYQHPRKFAGKLKVLHDTGAGDIIYEIPRRYRSLGRVVDRSRHAALPPLKGVPSMETLQLWHDVVENGPERPADVRFEGTDSIRVKARTGPGESILLQESFDSNWRAYRNGERIPVRRDNLGFMVLDVPPGEHEIRMEFPMPFSNKAGWVLTALSVIAVAGLVRLGRKSS